MERFVYLEIANLLAMCYEWGERDVCAILSENKVVGLSNGALAGGVTLGMSKSRAMSQLDHLEFYPRDPKKEARIASTVAEALEGVSPYFRYIDVTSSYLPYRAVMRYFKEPGALIHSIRETLSQLEISEGRRIADGDIFIGIADGLIAAKAASFHNLIIQRDASQKFLESLPVTVLGDDDVIDMLIRLGISTVGDFVHMDLADVSARFGARGLELFEMAHGQRTYPPRFSPPPGGGKVSFVADSPLVGYEQVVFSQIPKLADEVAKLRDVGLMATSVEISISTTRSNSRRSWSLFSGFDERSIAERIIWQLQGMEEHVEGSSAWEGINGWQVEFLDVVGKIGIQMDLFGSLKAPPELTVRAANRAETILGVNSVCVPYVKGARLPIDTVGFSRWQEYWQESSSRPRGHLGKSSFYRVSVDQRADDPPWPGSIPDPPPARVFRDSQFVKVTSLTGEVVRVNSRGGVLLPPSRVEFSWGTRRVEDFLGPWLVHQRWWNGDSEQRFARLLVLLDDGTAHILLTHNGLWYLEASYD